MAEERILIRQNPKGIESQTRFVDVIMYLLTLEMGCWELMMRQNLR